MYIYTNNSLTRAIIPNKKDNFAFRDTPGELLEQNVRLPKLSLPRFSGNVQWKGFLDSFQAAVHNNASVSPINKFNYLKANLEGKALIVVIGLDLSRENYEVAVLKLNTRFGDTNTILETHYSQVQQLSPVSNQLFHLRTFVDTFELNLRALEALGECTDTNQMLKLFRPKLPTDLLFELDLRKRDERWKLTTFRAALQAYMKAQEDARSLHNHSVPAFTPALPPRTEASSSNWRRPDNQYRPIVRSPSNRGITPATRLSGSTSSTRSPKCKYCAEPHYPDECRRFPDVDSRKHRILGHCFKCLGNNHTALQCKV